MNETRIAVTLVCGVLSALAGCSYNPSVTHPVVAAPRAADIGLSCPQIDLAIDRTDTVRWLIRDDGARLESDAAQAGRYTANVFVIALSTLALFPTALPDGGSAVLDAADGRLLKLLQLKRDRRCPARATAHAGIDDRALTAELEAIDARILGPEGRGRALLDERTRLLDGLRAMPACGDGPAPDGGPTCAASGASL
jgi:hypothetical protein